MDQLNQLKAFRLEENGEVVYNTYNLLRGGDVKRQAHRISDIQKAVFPK
jgi:hypothetical protein